MALVFWFSFAAIAYVYLGYPLLLTAWARLRPRPVSSGQRRGAGGFLNEGPGVSIVIAARNEGQRIGARLQNLLDLQYPSSRRQIIVVSDGSTDDTVSRTEAVAGIETIAV